jgi:predicted Na+-dependent transporter
MNKQIWKRTRTYLFVVAVCILILLLEWLVISILDAMNMGEYVNDDIAEGLIFFVCIPGILTGIIGAIICRVRKK